MYFPRLTGATTEQPQEIVAAENTGSGESILVVEDNDDVRAFTAQLLREVGYRVIAVPDGKAALAALGQLADVDLLFTDIGLPGGMTGRELVEQARNQIRGLLGEFGLVIPKGIWHVAERVPTLLEDASNELPLAFRQLIDRLTQHLKDLDQQVRELERQIIAWHRSSELSRKLEKIPGIGPLAATALVASIADARSIDNGRQVSAWLGLVPRQNSSGGKATLLGISKRGDVYLRTLLIHGARSAILAARRKTQNTNVWLANLLTRRHPNIAAVALANKNAQTAWALLAHGREFHADYLPAVTAA
jgi:CheY-like chemotaxis protein